MIVQLQYLPFRKTNANPVVGHGMIKLSKSLHFTWIGIRTLYSESIRENCVKCPRERKPNIKRFQRSSSDRIRYHGEENIQTLLENPLDSKILSESATKLRDYIQDIPANKRHYSLVKELKREHISKMWEIARYNRYDCAASMMPPMESTDLLPEYWRWKINRGTWLSSIMGSASGHFQMAFFRDKDRCLYGRIIRGTVDKISIHKQPLYFIVKGANGAPLDENRCCLAFELEEGEHQLELPQRVPGNILKKTNINKVSPLDIVAKNPSESSTIAHIYSFVFEFGDGKREIHEIPRHFPKPAKHPQEFIDQQIFIRCAGPNVLVGQAWGKGQTHLGEIILVKKRK